MGIIETVETYFHDFDTNGTFEEAGVKVTENSCEIGAKPES